MTADDKAAVSGSANAAAQPSELKRLGKYQIEKKIGAGGMGAVFLARDVELKRIVALKVLPRDKAANPTLVRRFRAEAQAAAQLRHDNIVAVYDSGEADGYLYIAMEYVDGQDLFEMVARRGVIPVRRSIEIIRQVASALQHAFEQNIVHRDIKPSNLLIRRDGVVKLTDLGLARSVDDTLETNITRAGTTVGTVDYMSPEQARHSKLADIRSDLYSLGCTWYQMLTGMPPYPEGSVTNKLQAHAVKPIPDPRDKNPRVPEGLTAVIRRMMAKKPEERYQTPAELIDELDHATLTQAAISREIFSDLSDYDQDATVQFEDGEEEGDSSGDDNGYVGSHGAETPPEVSTRTGPGRPTAARPKRASEPDEQPESPSMGKPRPAKGPRPAAEPDQKSSSSGGKPLRPTAADVDDTGEQSPVTESGARKLKLRPSRPEGTESQSQAMGKVSDDKSAKPKPPAQKQLPPKRQPTSEPDEAKPGALQDIGKYLGAAAGVIVVVGGLGWIISNYGGGIGLNSNPFSPEPVAAPPVVVNPVVPTASVATSADPATTVPSSDPANASTTAGATKSDGTTGSFDVEKLPGWVHRENEPPGLVQLTVGPAAASATHFNRLDDALQAVPAAGAIIRLQGDGPFSLSQVELANRRYILITGVASQSQPVITLKPAESQSTAGLKLSDGKLELRGVHFVMDRQQVTGAIRAVEVVDGQLTVRQCSFTASGTGTAPAVAMTVSSTQDAVSVPRIDPTLFVDQVFVRGDGLVGIRVDRANLDGVIRNTLMATGAANAVEVTGHVTAALAEVATIQPRRILRLFHSTLCAHNRVFDISVDESGKPPQTAIVLRDSLCCSQGTAAGSTVAFLGRWPQIQSNTRSWFTKLTWTSTNSLYIGFEQLLDLGASFKVADTTTWQRVWNSKADIRQFQKFTFPEMVLDDLSTVLPQDFDPKALSFRDVKASDGGPPGCAASQVSVPDANSQSRVQAVASRPVLPAIAVKSQAPVDVRKVDLKKEDLGTILNRGDWRSGTLFEASGGGLCLMTPARIEGKSVKIVFRQTEGANLKLQPAQPKSGDPARTEAPALFSIVRGSLEITNAVLEGWPNSKGFTPDWLVQSVDSTVVLNGCRLLGSESESSRQLGLIRWVASVQEQRPPEPPALVCRDCYLAGMGCGIRQEAGIGNLILRNTIIAVRGDALDLRPVRAGNQLLPIVDVESTTISATGAAIRFEAAPGQDTVASPMRVYFDRTVFGPPLTFKAGESAGATLLKYKGPALQQKQLSWWGSSNGVARQVVSLIRSEEDTAAPTDERTGLTAWRQCWDKTNSLRFLTGEKGVYLVAELPNRWRDLRPASFELHKNSQASTWADGGRRIGANTSEVDTVSFAKKGGTEPANKAVGTPVVAPTKKNPGF